jgi:hypothetical protein
VLGPKFGRIEFAQV